MTAKEKCYTCRTEGVVCDMFILSDPIEENEERVCSYFCSLTCLEERLK